MNQRSPINIDTAPNLVCLLKMEAAGSAETIFTIS